MLVLAREDKANRRFQASIHGYEIHDDADPISRRPVRRTRLRSNHDLRARRLKGR